MSARLHQPLSNRLMTNRGLVRLRTDDDDPTSELQTEDPTADLEAIALPEPRIPHEEPIQGPELSGSVSAPNPAAPPELLQVPKRLEVGPGTVLRERYLLQQVIGSGGTSMVYRAQDLRHEAGDSSLRVIAVKLLREELREDARAIERLKREFTQMQLLAHPGVLKVFDLDVDRGVWFMTMEMLEGQSLSMYLRTHRTPHPQGLELIKSCAEALLFAHERGIVHGDLKPGNIFLTSAGVRVLDFIGAADELRTDRAATPAYASPQRLAGEMPEVSDDIYSLGCVAYEVLSGVHPFERKPASVAHQLGLQPARINSLSYRQWRALDRALAFDRRDRHASMHAFLDALFVAEAREAAATPLRTGPSADERSGRTARADASSSAGIIPVTMPAAVLTVPPHVVAPSARPAADGGPSDLAAPTATAQGEESSLALRQQEVLIEPLRDIPGDTSKPLPPIFEPQRRSAVLPVIIALLLAALGLYLARSDIDSGTRHSSPTAATAPTAAASSTSEDRGAAVPPSSATTPPPVASAAGSVVAPPPVPATAAANESRAAEAKPPKSKTAATKAGTATKVTANSVGFVTSRVSVSERSLAAVLQVKRLGSSTAGRLPIHWRTEKRSAQPGEDYTEVTSGTLVLQDGQRMGAIYVPIVNDDVSESDEMFVVELVDTAASAAPDIGLAIITIRDDDRMPLAANSQ